MCCFVVEMFSSSCVWSCVYLWEGGGPEVMALGKHQVQLLFLVWASCMLCSRFLGRGVCLESFSPPPHCPYGEMRLCGRLQENLRTVWLVTSGSLLNVFWWDEAGPGAAGQAAHPGMCTILLSPSRLQMGCCLDAYGP